MNYYYNVLEVKKESTMQDIRKSYAKLTSKIQCLKNSQNELLSLEKLKEISEAYEILGQKETRKLNDKYGYFQLKAGINIPKDSMIVNFTFRPRPHNEVFSEFFDNFGDLNFDHPSFIFYQNTRDLNVKKSVELDLFVSLEEIYNSNLKKYKVSRSILTDSGVKKEDKIISIQLESFWRTGYKIFLENQGDELQRGVFQDVILVLREKTHPQFIRKNKDLHMNIGLNIKEALTGYSINIRAINGKNYQIKDHNIVSDGILVQFDKLGMKAKSGEYGSLVVNFNINFPNSLNENQRSKLKRTFDEIGL